MRRLVALTEPVTVLFTASVAEALFNVMTEDDLRVVLSSNCAPIFALLEPIVKGKAFGSTVTIVSTSANPTPLLGREHPNIDRDLRDHVERHRQQLSERYASLADLRPRASDGHRQGGEFNQRKDERNAASSRHRKDSASHADSEQREHKRRQRWHAKVKSHGNKRRPARQDARPERRDPM